MRRGQAFKATSEEDRKRVLALARKGENGLAIAKTTGIPKSTVYEILARGETAPAKGARRAGRAVPATEEGPAGTAAAAPPLDVLRGELAELERRIRLARQGSGKVHLAAVKAYAQLAEVVRKLEPPPPPPPPDEDPENLGLKAELRERLERLRVDTMATAQGRAQVRAYLDGLEAEAAREQAA